jgi:hypothetical protein
MILDTTATGITITGTVIGTDSADAISTKIKEINEPRSGNDRGFVLGQRDREGAPAGDVAYRKRRQTPGVVGWR